jgi:Flp pilus assembly protein TadD
MELEPREPDSPVELGRILLEEGRRGEAAEMFRRALAVAPENAAARKGLADASP